MVGRAGRNDFTESDDDKLIEFIAHVKPDKYGRLGNNLYIFLEQSADNRPWAKRHSWQSWRERYKKNQDWFNHKIKQYQRKLKDSSEMQARRKKPEHNSTVVNGNDKRTMVKVKSESNVEKLVQPQVDEPEKRKYNGHASTIPLATSSTLASTIRQASSATEREVLISPSSTYEHAPHLVDHKSLRQSPVTSKTSSARVSSERDYSSSLPSESEDEKDSEEESVSETEDREELYRELFGISQFSDDSGDETLDAHKRLLAPPSSNVNQGNIYPSIANIPQPGTVDKEHHIPGSYDGVVNTGAMPIFPRAQEPAPKSVISSGPKATATGAATALQPTRPPQHIHGKPKRKVLPRHDDSNFFGTPSPSPSSKLGGLPSAIELAAGSANSIAKGEPPTLFEGPYRSSLKRTRATSGNVANDELWPPKRRKKTEDIGVISPDVKMSYTRNARGRIETKTAFPVTLSATGCANGLAQPRPRAQVNAVASSSKVLLPDPPHRHANPTNLLKMICAKETLSSNISFKNKSLANSVIQTVANNGPKFVPTDAAPLPKTMKDTKSSLVIDKRKHVGRVASSGFRNSVPIKPMPRLIATPNDGSATLQLTRASPVDSDDPFIANKPLNKGKTRASSPVRNLILHDQPPRRIDLRHSLNNHAIRRSSNLGSRASTSSTSRHSITFFLLPEDQEIINQVGFTEVMAMVAKHYGFDVDVAMNAFFATKSIEKTKSVLQHAKEVANSATSVLLAELVSQAKRDDVDSCGDEEPQSMWRGRSSSSGKDQSASSGRQKAERSSGSRKAKRPSLNIKPQPFNEEIDQNVLSDYSPPHVSRAGQFMRLLKQGRGKEAVDRERRRASGAFVAQTQAQSCDEDQRQKSSSLMPNSSSTRNSGKEPMDIDSCDDDDLQPPVVTPHEDIVQHQFPDDVSPVDHHRIFFKRISEGLSTLNEDEDDPAVFRLAQEHRDLVMDVTEENADALRSFERKNNQDLLRLWSLDWMRQKTADM